jgi:hypothetical protein
VFWDITPCSLLKVNQRFRGTCCLHLQGQRISQARNQCVAELCFLPPSYWFLACLILQNWRWKQYIPLKCQMTFNGLHSITSQKIELIITTTVRTANPTNLLMKFIKMEWGFKSYHSGCTPLKQPWVPYITVTVQSNFHNIFKCSVLGLW